MPLDIGIGLLLGLLLADMSEISLSLSLLIGVSAALLPDIDFIYSYLKHKVVPTTEHRDGLHYPLIVIPSVTLIGYAIAPEVGLVLFLGTLIHFLHDSVGVGFGVKWLFPFKKNSYLFFFQIKTPTNHDMPKQLLYSWNDEERAEAIRKWGYKDWIRYVYFKANAWGIFEYSVFFIGIVSVIIYA